MQPHVQKDTAELQRTVVYPFIQVTETPYKSDHLESQFPIGNPKSTETYYKSDHWESHPVWGITFI